MATSTANEEEVYYESDPEEEKRLLAMRRREASDDEDGEGEGREKLRLDRRVGIHSDESDGQGGIAEYDVEEEELGPEEEDVIDEEEGEEADVYEERHSQRDVGGSKIVVNESNGDESGYVEESMDANVGNQGEEEDGEKKEHEPFAVPTAGAFYMHDDRFKGNAIGRNRRGGRRLWESKDERKWGHDMFEEMTLQERHYDEERRVPRGRYRGRGSNRGIYRGYARGNRSREFNNTNNQEHNSNNNSHHHAPKGGRGRGSRDSRHYERITKNNSQAQAPPSNNKNRSGKHFEKSSHNTTRRAFVPTSNAETEPAPSRKHVFASSLNYASPPFYPSGSSNKDIPLTHKKDVQAGGTSRNHCVDENLSGLSNNAYLRGKNIAESEGRDRIYIDDSINSTAGSPLTNQKTPSYGPSLHNTVQSSQSSAQGRGTIAGPVSYQSSPHNQGSRTSSPGQPHSVSQISVQSRVQPIVQTPAQNLGQQSVSGSQASSPTKAALTSNSIEAGELESSSESSKLRGALVGKGKGTIQGSGTGSFLYGGAQVMGATGSMNVTNGDQNFPGTPAFLPVMQFGGQHPGGMGVPAVGMAFPGYVAQPQLGMGNSEMTWLPVLAGAAGALGATYCSPYIAVDPSYRVRPSGQALSVGTSSKEDGTDKPENDWKSLQRTEPVSDEFGHRQNKPRRYSEMNFGQ